MAAVGEAAMETIQEVRRQFRQIPGLLQGTAKCMNVSTSTAIKRMVMPGVLAGQAGTEGRPAERGTPQGTAWFS